MALDHTHAAMRTWAVLGMAISLAPAAVWAATVWKDHREHRRLADADAQAPAPEQVHEQVPPHPHPRVPEGNEPAPAPALATASPSAPVSGTTTGGS